MRRFYQSRGKGATRSRAKKQVLAKDDESAHSSDSEEIDILIYFSDDSEQEEAEGDDGIDDTDESENLVESTSSPSPKVPILDNIEKENASAETTPESQTTTSNLSDDASRGSSEELLTEPQEIYLSQEALEAFQKASSNNEEANDEIGQRATLQDFPMNTTLSYDEFVEQARWLTEVTTAQETQLKNLAGWKLAKVESAGMSDSYFLEHEPIHRKLSLSSEQPNDIVDSVIPLADDSIDPDPDTTSTTINEQACQSSTTAWYLSIVYSDTWQCPVLYFRIENAQDGSLVTDRQIILQWLQHVHHQNPSATEDAAGTDQPLQDFHEFISWDEHPLLQMPSFFLHPCQTKTRLESMMAFDKTSHQPAQSTTYLLSWMSLMLPAVGVPVSSKEWLVLNEARKGTSDMHLKLATHDTVVPPDESDGRSCHSDDTTPMGNVSDKYLSARRSSSNVSSSSRQAVDSQPPQYSFKPVTLHSTPTSTQSDRVMMNPWDLRNQAHAQAAKGPSDSNPQSKPPGIVTSDPIFDDLPTFREKHKRRFRRSMRAPSPPSSDDARVSESDMSQQMRNSKLNAQQYSQASEKKRFSKFLSPFRCLVPRRESKAPQSTHRGVGRRHAPSDGSDPMAVSSTNGQANDEGPFGSADVSHPLTGDNILEPQKIEITDDTRKVVHILAGDLESGNGITAAAASKALEEMKRKDELRQKERQGRDEERKEVQKDFIKLTMELNRKKRIYRGYELAQAELKNEVNETKTLLEQARKENKSLQVAKGVAEEAKVLVLKSNKEEPERLMGTQSGLEKDQNQIDQLTKENHQMQEKLKGRAGLQEEELSLRSQIDSLSKRIQEIQHQKHERKRRNAEMRSKISTLRREKDEMTTQLYGLKLYEKQLELKAMEDDGPDLAAKAELEEVTKERDEAVQELALATSEMERRTSESQKVSSEVAVLQNQIESINDQVFDVMGEIRKLRPHEGDKELSQRKAHIRAAYFSKEENDSRSRSTVRVSSPKNKYTPPQGRDATPFKRAGSLINKFNVSPNTSRRATSPQQVQANHGRVRALKKEIERSDQEAAALEAQVLKTEERLRRKTPTPERRVVHNTVYPPAVARQKKESRQSHRHSKNFNKSLDRLIFSSSAHDLVVGQLVAV